MSDDEGFRKIEYSDLDVTFRGNKSPLEEGASQAAAAQCHAAAKELIDRGSSFILVAITDSAKAAAEVGVDPEDYAFSVESIGSLSGPGNLLGELLYETIVYSIDRLALMANTEKEAAMIGVFQRFMMESLTREMPDEADDASD